MPEYKVGYGKPPKNSQFKPGQSGNIKGRPKGQLSTMQLIQKHLASMITVQSGGQTKKVTRREALVMSAIADALKSEKIRKQFIELALSIEAQMPSTDSQPASEAEDQTVIDALLYRYGTGPKPRKSTKLSKGELVQKPAKGHVGATKT